MLLRQAVFGDVADTGMGELIEGDGRPLWIAMVETYRREASALGKVRECIEAAKRAKLSVLDPPPVVKPFEAIIAEILQGGTSDDVKRAQIRKMLGGSLGKVDWSALEVVVAHPALAGEGIELLHQAKAATFYEALESDDWRYVTELLEDPDIQALEYSVEARAAREKSSQRRKHLG
jgi:hypothetical protein